MYISRNILSSTYVLHYYIAIATAFIIHLNILPWQQLCPHGLMSTLEPEQSLPLQ